METYELPTVVDREQHIYDSGSTSEVTQAQEVRHVVSVNTRPREHRKKMLILIVVLCMVLVVVIGAVSWLVYITMEQSDKIKTLIERSGDARQMINESANEIKVLENQISELALSTVQGTDCSDIKARNRSTEDGIYLIRPGNGLQFFSVFCDMSTDEGGWTVFQQRLDGSVDFYRDWNAYKTGFGNLNGEFWLGNDKLHALTSSGKYKLKIVLGDWDGELRYSDYSSFAIGSPATNYRLSVSGYSGNAGGGMRFNNGNQFSTKDRDNDKYRRGNCAVDIVGAWWYNSCTESNLNGEYLNGKHSKSDKHRGVNWYYWKGWHYSLKQSKMMIHRA